MAGCGVALVVLREAFVVLRIAVGWSVALWLWRSSGVCAVGLGVWRNLLVSAPPCRKVSSPVRIYRLGPLGSLYSLTAMRMKREVLRKIHSALPVRSHNNK